jgi:prepilin-type N-terminal cleavage/methylation domain-containing protein
MFMHETKRYRDGFTLLEVLTVTVIVSILTSMSVLAVNQAFQRRHSSHADQLLIWLQQLSEQSALTGVVYGVSHTKSDSEYKLKPLVYFRNRWLETTSISPFILDADAEIRWSISVDKDSIMPVDRAADGLSSPESEFNASESGLLPIVAFMPDGYIEPDKQLELKFGKSSRVYEFSWNYKTASVKMGSYNQ